MKVTEKYQAGSGTSAASSRLRIIGVLAEAAFAMRMLNPHDDVAGSS